MSINEIIALSIIGIAVIACIVLLFKNDDKLKIIGVLLVVALSIFSFDFWLVFAALFIVATLVTELSFLQNLAAIIRGSNKEYFDYMKTAQGETEYESENISQDEEEDILDDNMAKKILNTLWTLQTKKFPNLKKLFTFRVEEGSLDSNRFKEATEKLINRRLVLLTPNGQLALTDKGLKFLKKNYDKLGDDRYFEEEEAKEENIPKIIESIEKKFQ